MLVPKDGQEHAVAGIEALYGAPPREGVLHKLLNAQFSVGGTLCKFPQVVCTDYVSRDHNTWARASKAVMEACLKHKIPVMIPKGVCDEPVLSRLKSSIVHKCLMWTCI